MPTAPASSGALVARREVPGAAGWVGDDAGGPRRDELRCVAEDVIREQARDVVAVDGERVVADGAAVLSVWGLALGSAAWFQRITFFQQLHVAPTMTRSKGRPDVIATDLVYWKSQTRLHPVRGKGVSHLNASLSTEH